MADYNGVIVEGSQFEYYRKATPVGLMVNGAARLITSVPEYPSGSESVSGGMDFPALEIKRGGSVKMFAGMEVGAKARCLVYLPAGGKVGFKIWTRAGTMVAEEHLTGSGGWELAEVELPSGWPKAVYVLALANHSEHDNDVDKRVYADSFEVI